MTLAFAALIGGLVLLVWSANRFVDGAAATARHLGMPSLLIGMLIIGFGTSAPEIVLSALAASQGNPGIALGNAYGSNIANIALILGITALVAPISVHTQVLRKELPVLLAVTALAAWQVSDGFISDLDAWLLLALFAGLMAWSIWHGISQKQSPLGDEVEQELAQHPMSLQRALFWVVLGLTLLVGSSRILVWGAVEIAQSLGVSDLVIGLTIIAIGTSLPELASTLAAVRKGEHDMAIGNVIGSNLFNTLAVVGIAGAIQPMSAEPAVFSRDVLMMSVLTIALLFFGYGHKGTGHINRIEGGLLLASYIAYTVYLLMTTVFNTQ